jgi:hypothetical protein
LKRVLTKAQHFVCKNEWCEFRNQVVLRASNNGIPQCTCGLKMKRVYSQPQLVLAYVPRPGRECSR